MALAMIAIASLAAPLWSSAGALDGRPAIVVEARVGDHGDKTRFVLEVTAPRDFLLHAEPAPHRLIIEFEDLDWPEAASGGGAGMISGYECVAMQPAGIRCILTLDGPAAVRDIFYLPATATVPFRFVLDLEASDDEAFAQMVARPVRAQLEADPVPVALGIPLPPRRPGTQVPVVAIDAGHGGIDPGAIGVSGLFEKTVTLSVALLLRDILEATGEYEVFLTRDDDTFLRLRERVQLAREADADLFISLHADSTEGDSIIRGASVYTLSDRASDQEAAMLAARENRADALGQIALDPDDDMMAEILIDLSQRLTQNESNLLAELMVEHLGEATRLLPNRAHRVAGFAVLKAPDVPSVLVEMGYLSNAEDEALLASEAHQQAIAESIADAVESYFAWLADLQRS